ncbi:CARDB domain-containing protein [uncultured Thiodictyon sp.]|uniref:RCC1 domain-containing protein n=1 Tax=uncultured Thiodictyon sp. TaxID=1846217 RepID=UPI0025E66A65|nr:CARDB domain-containing protein [uncultured Thiodictyon sp.]
MAATPAVTEQALRDRVSIAGWVQVRVDLNAPAGAAVPPLPADWDQAAQDLLLGLTAGSYDSPLHVPGEASLTVRVNATALNQLLTSPLVAAVAAGGNADMRRLAAGNVHSLFIDATGDLWAWGDNWYGQLGDNTTTNRESPVHVLTDVAAVAAGTFHSLAIKTDGSLWAWGNNANGELGHDTGINSLVPVQIMTGVVAVAAGHNHTLAIKSDGSLWAWGSNTCGKLGIATSTGLPAQVMTGVAAVAGGAPYTLAVKTDGSLWAWGCNLAGSLGDGTTTDSLIPIKVLTGVANVTSGGGDSFAVMTDGKLLAWGANNSGQVGDGTITTSPNPIEVLTGVVAATGGKQDHTLALKTDGSLWAWGSNAVGQLGVGAFDNGIHPTTPVQVMTGIAAMAAGGFHSLALTTDGQLLAWGFNPGGQLGDGTTIDRSSPGGVRRFGQLPDFVVASVLLTPGSPSINGTFSADVTVTNQGMVVGEPGTLQIWANESAPQGCPALGDQAATLRRLAVDESQTVTFSLSSGVGGPKMLRAFINSDCSVAEADTTNNQTVQSYTVVAPDFVVTAVTLTPSSPSANGTLDAAVTVTNQGMAPGNPGTLRVWADQTDAQFCGAVGDQSATLPSLAVGESQTITVSGLPAGVAGAKTLRAFIDSQCQTTESDETNNQQATPYTVVPQDIDLAVSAVVLKPRSPVPGGTFDVSVTVTNKGTVATASGALLQVWADQSAVQDCGAIGDQSATLPSLAAGASQSVTFTGLPAGALGAKTLRAFVDSACATPETEEANNQSATAYHVSAPAPDFSVSEIVVNPHTAPVNGTFEAKITVTNGGTADGAAGTLQVWADQPAVQTCGAVGDQSVALPTLAAGASQTFTVTGLPAGALGVKSLRAFVDSACLTAETDETDNQTVIGYPGGNADMRRLAAGWGQSLFIDAAGDLWAWGQGVAVGDGTWNNRSNPVRVLTGVATVVSGEAHTVALKTDGSLWAWGENAHGQLGNGQLGDVITASQLTPVKILTGVAAVAAGAYHTLALTTDGKLWAWGWNWCGQVGDGTTTDQPSPVLILTGVAAMAAGAYHTLAIRTDGSLWAWGNNTYGQLGGATNYDNQATPIQVLSGFAAVAAGSNYSLALTPDGSLWAWGYNGAGALGDGSTTYRGTPVQVLSGVAAVAAGAAHTLALKPDGSLWAWGWNAYGQLGDGTTTNRLSPLQALSGVAAVAGGSSAHTLVLTTDGKLWAWGSNAYGQLGDGTTTDNANPGKVLGIGQMPDFVVTGISLPLGSPSVNGYFDVDVTVKNQGTAAGEPRTLQVWADQAGAQPCGAVGDQTSTLSPLAVGAIRTVSFSGLSAGAAGAKTLRAFINSACSAAESDTTNNQTTQPYTVVAPDFIVTGVTLTPASPSANGTFSAAVTVTNQGTAAGNPGALQVWGDQTGAQFCGAVGDQSAALPSLAVGESQTVTVTGLPAGVAGAKTLRAFVDSACQASEANETNNQYAKAYPVFGPSAVEECQQFGTVPVMQGEYSVQNNVWNATTTQCVKVDPTVAGFAVSQSAHNATTVASYPSIFRGCHWATCTTNSGMPVAIGRIARAPFSWSVTPAPSVTGNIAAEAWFSPRQAPDAQLGYDGGGELMIWLDSNGMVPSGTRVATTTIGGATWEVWYDAPNAGRNWQYIAYRQPQRVTAVNLDLNDFIRDALARGYLDRSWYLHDLEAGEEIMSGGAGFATDAFSFVTTNLNSYAITASAAPAAGGVASCTPNPVDEGSTSLCAATANPGYGFAGWRGDCAGQAGRTCTLSNITAAKAVTATYVDMAQALPGRAGWRAVVGP